MYGRTGERNMAQSGVLGFVSQFRDGEYKDNNEVKVEKRTRITKSKGKLYKGS